MKTFGDKVKDRRIELGLSQSDLAKRLGYSPRGAISYIENDTTDVSQKKRKELARVLRVPISYFFEPEVEPLEAQSLPLIGEIAAGTPIFAETIKLV